ncbi:MAG: hypothetical protein JKX69_01540 [Rhodobacteraceae bacterium]|nr:hypothetical protein [Paracoccaceae bacterium]PHR53369.1 MAG: hypothetical protein COA47_16900 [Robiginitomaculum sp.]
MAEITSERIDALIHGAIDLHCHSGPSIMDRKLNHIEAAQEADAAGMRAIAYKDHYYGTTPAIRILKESVLADARIELIGGIVLNNSVGGFNPYAVEHDLKMGGRMIWMPTLSAANHMRYFHRSKFIGPGTTMRKHEALSVVDRRGNIIEAVQQVLETIAEYDGVLSAGHLHISEIWPLFEAARKAGITRLLVNHPMLFIGCTLADMTELAADGVYLEQCACMLIDCPGRHHTNAELHSFIEAAGVDQTILSSDLGQLTNPRPVEGFREVIEICLTLGYSDDDVRKMVSTNATKLLGLDEVAA